MSISSARRSPHTATASHRWTALGLGIFAQASGLTLLFGAALLIPTLQHDHGLDLSNAGLIVAAPTAGTVTTFLGWGTLVDRIGERLVLVAGSCATAIGSLTAAFTSDRIAVMAIAMFVGGVGVAGTNSAGPTLITVSFPPDQRGLAVSIRQTVTPIGIGLAALTMPRLAETAGVSAALAVPTVLATIAAITCGLGITDPPPTPAHPLGHHDNPYRSDRRTLLLRVHLISTLLGVPQNTLLTFTYLWLHSYRGWSAAAAGTLVMVVNSIAIVSRIGSGIWSDRVGSRLAPLHTIAIASAIALTALAAADQAPNTLAIPIMVAATIIAASDRCLVFAAAIEIAGPRWCGRSLGIQNTAGFLTSTAIPPALGAAITAHGFPAAFLAAATCAAAAALVISAARRHEPPGGFNTR